MFKYLIFYFYEKDEFTDGHGIVELAVQHKINSINDIKDIQKKIRVGLNYMSVCITGYNLISEN